MPPRITIKLTNQIPTLEKRCIVKFYNLVPPVSSECLSDGFPLSKSTHQTGEIFTLSTMSCGREQFKQPVRIPVYVYKFTIPYNANTAARQDWSFRVHGHRLFVLSTQTTTENRNRRGKDKLLFYCCPIVKPFLIYECI